MSKTKPIHVRVTNKENGEPGVWLEFPSEREVVMAALQPLGEGPHIVEEYVCQIAGFEHLLPRNANLNLLNFLAGQIARLDATGEAVLEAVLASEACPNNICALVNLCANVDCFELYPGICNSADLGMSRISEVHAGITELVRVQEGSTSDEQSLSGYLSLLEEHFDYSAYGRAEAKEEGGIFTPRGYLCRNPENVFLPIYDGEYILQSKRVLDTPAPKRDSAVTRAI